VSAHHDWSDRRYEDAVLAALDFRPDFDPFRVEGGRRVRRRRQLISVLCGVGVVYVGLAVLLALALAGGWSTPTVVIIGLLWLSGTAGVIALVVTLIAPRRPAG
jgi:hypothetical protein